MSDISVIKSSKLKVNKLHFQYVHGTFNPKFWMGKESLLVQHSPHVSLLKKYEQVGNDMDALLNSDYARMHEYWNSVGYIRFNGKQRDRKYIIFKINRITTLYDSIKKKGFKKKHFIQVLNKPFWISRYKKDIPFLEGYEIWHGHHRSAVCHVLGIEKIPCEICCDSKPGTKKCKKFERN